MEIIKYFLVPLQEIFMSKIQISLLAMLGQRVTQYGSGFGAGVSEHWNS